MQIHDWFHWVVIWETTEAFMVCNSTLVRSVSLYPGALFWKRFSNGIMFYLMTLQRHTRAWGGIFYSQMCNPIYLPVLTYWIWIAIMGKTPSLSTLCFQALNFGRAGFNLDPTSWKLVFSKVTRLSCSLFLCLLWTAMDFAITFIFLLINILCYRFFDSQSRSLWSSVKAILIL